GRPTRHRRDVTCGGDLGTTVTTNVPASTTSTVAATAAPLTATTSPSPSPPISEVLVLDVLATIEIERETPDGYDRGRLLGVGRTPTGTGATPGRRC
ncbi:MAG: hypothetical protein WEB55_01045, partial [Acidimicrobiia bacterium]